MHSSKTITWSLFFAGLAMSFGWGIRGNFGHELGAMIPGALIGLSVCLIANREDWLKRWPLFGLFGAVGWAFGGQMSYGLVIGFTRSAQFGTALYGYAGLFLIGGLWAAAGIGILMIPALWNRQRIQELFPPFLVILVIWALQDVILIHFFGDTEPDFLNYCDTDWLPAATALLGILSIALVQKKISHALGLFLHLIIGWFLGLFLFVTVLGLHLSPPRSDNWAGMLGLVAGLIFYFWKNHEKRILWAMAGAFIFGGIGFSVGDLIQTLGATSPLAIDWWKIMEETFGFIMGVGVAWLFTKLRAAATPARNDAAEVPWVTGFSIYFLSVILFYMLFVRSFHTLINSKLVPEFFWGIHTKAWFQGAFLLYGMATLYFLWKIFKKKKPILPVSRLGRLEAFLLFFSWASFFLDAGFHLYPFSAHSILVQGFFFVAALLLTLFIGLFDQPPFVPPNSPAKVLRWRPLVFTLLLWIPTLLLAETWISLISHREALPGAHKRFSERKNKRSEASRDFTFWDNENHPQFVYQNEQYEFEKRD